MEILKALWEDPEFLAMATTVLIAVSWLLFICLTIKTTKEKKEEDK